LLILLLPLCLSAQEENAGVAKEGTKYVSLKIKSLDKYNSRIERQQHILIKKLKKKEDHYAKKLKSTDSLAYTKYQKQSLSFDSISKVSKSDTGSTAEKFAQKKNGTIDSLRGIQSFVQSKSGVSANTPAVPNSNAELSQLKGKLNFRTYINQLITQHTNELKNLGSQSNVPGLTGIQKQIFYAKGRMKAFKDIEEEPTKAEDEAMDYLQGTSGFDKAMKSATGGGTGSMESLSASGADAAQMEKMGYQTKQQLQGSLQQKFGGSIGSISKQMSGELSQWKEKQNDISSLKETKQSLKNLKNTEKPAFKVNPMRELPFWKRIEKQYSWQTARPSADGTQPAAIKPSASVGFKHSPKLTYGLGIGTSFGLGQSWQNIHFSFQGIGFKSFTTWEWQYGIGLYTGYERMYKNFLFKQSTPTAATDAPTVHNTANYNESLLFGLTKKYHINSKYNGSIEVLYDIWWQQKGLQSPIVLRFTTTTK
jgi:hypothetical protein